MTKGFLDNADIAELLAREAEEAEGHRQIAFKRACHEAFLWPEEAIYCSNGSSLDRITTSFAEASRASR